METPAVDSLEAVETVLGSGTYQREERWDRERKYARYSRQLVVFAPLEGGRYLIKIHIVMLIYHFVGPSKSTENARDGDEDSVDHRLLGRGIARIHHWPENKAIAKRGRRCNDADDDSAE